MSRATLLSLIGTSSAGSGLGITALCGGFDKGSALSSLMFDESMSNDFPRLASNERVTSNILNYLPNVYLESSKKVFNKHNSIACTRYVLDGARWKDPKKSNEDSGRVDLAKRSEENRKTRLKHLQLKNENLKGCLSVWWEKETFNTGKWNGKWNLIWAISNEEHAIILSSTVKTEDRKFYVDGQGYTLKKEGNTWETVGSQYTSWTEITKDNKDKFIIKAGTATEEKETWWGFGFEEANMCRRSERDACIEGTGSKDSYKKNWILVSWPEETKGKYKSQPIEKWSSNSGAWGKKDGRGVLFSTFHSGIYKDIKGYFKLVSPQ